MHELYAGMNLPHHTYVTNINQSGVEIITDFISRLKTY